RSMAAMSGRPRRSVAPCPLLAAGLLLLAFVVSTPSFAVGDSNGVGPTAIYDRAVAEGQVRVLVELALPSGRRAGSPAATPGRRAFRRALAATAWRGLSRLAAPPHRVLRRYAATPMIALRVGPGALQELEASRLLVRRVMEDRIHRPVLVDSV